jgi:RHS repeat-associated protein
MFGGRKRWFSRKNSRKHRRPRFLRAGIERLERREVLSVSVNLLLPTSSSYGVNNSLAVEYTNNSAATVPAPVLILSADNANLWLPNDPAVVDTSLQLLATGSTGSPGTLAPGASGTIVVNFASTSQTANKINFSINELASGQTIDWASLKGNLRPNTIAADAWNAVFANFTTHVGMTTDSYQAVLDADANYLAGLGEPTNDVGRLVIYEINKADDKFSTSTLAANVDAGLPTPGGLSLSFERWFQAGVSGRYKQGSLGTGWTDNWDISFTTDSDGNVVINNSGTLRYFTPRSDGTYLGAVGDTDVLSKLSGGGFQLTENDGSSTVFNANGTLNSVQDSSGNKITTTFTGGLLTRLTASNGAFLSLAYTNGLLTSVTDSTGLTSTYTYDASSHDLLSYTGQFGTTSYSYVASQGTPLQNALASITFADNSHMFFSYDAQGRMTAEHQDNNQEAVTISYLAAGGLTTTDANGSSSTVLMDDNGQICQTTDGLGNVVRYTYDLSGDATAVNGPQGFKYSYTYDQNGNITSATDSLGLTTQYAFNASSDLTSYTDPRGNTTSYTYDNNHNLTSITYANGTQEHYNNYNSLGEVAQYVNANSQATGYQYNSQGLVTQESFADGSSYSYTYDAHGNVLTAASAAGTITFKYQNATNPLLLTEVDYPNGQFLKFAYNTIGQRTQSVDQTGFTVNYTYDALGRLQRSSDGNNNLIAQYIYDAAGNLIQQNNGNGTFTVYTYDANANVLSITNYAPSTGGASDDPTKSKVNSFDNYSYDSLGDVLTETNQDGVWNYTYDADGQTIRAVFAPNSSNPDKLKSQNIQYAYDAAGNRISQTVNGVATAYVANNVNEYTSSTTSGVITNYQYDNDGNLIGQNVGGSTTTYSYDQLDELIGVSGPDQTATYTYDPLGNRNGQTVNGVSTRFLIDPFGLGDIASSYSSGGNLNSHFTYGAGLTSEVSAAGSAAYYDFNLAGNTIGITGATGSYVNKYSYTPFGQSTTVAASLSNPFTFGGQFGVVQDGANLFNMRAREYSQLTGQFLDNDPLGLSGGDGNLRRYVQNSPVNLVDPDGTEPIPTGPSQSLWLHIPLNFKSDGSLEFILPSTAKIKGRVYERSCQAGLNILPLNSSITYTIPGTGTYETLSTFRGPDGKPTASIGATDVTGVLLRAPKVTTGLNGKWKAGKSKTPKSNTSQNVDGKLKLKKPANPTLPNPQEALRYPGDYRQLNPGQQQPPPPPPQQDVRGTLLKRLKSSLLLDSDPIADASDSTDNDQPGPPGGRLIEGMPASVVVGNLIYNGNPLPPPDDFTATTEWSDGVTTTDIVAFPGSLDDESGVTTPGATYDVYATRVFPKSGAYAVTYTTTITGPNTDLTLSDLTEIVYYAPLILNPVYYDVPEGGSYDGPIATFEDLDPDGNPGGYSSGEIESATLVPSSIQAGPGNNYTVVSNISYANSTSPDFLASVVPIFDVGTGPNPNGGDNLVDYPIIVPKGTPQYTTNVYSQIAQVNSSEPYTGTLATIQTTDPNVTGSSQITVTSDDPSVLITGETFTQLAGGIKQIAIQGIVNASSPGAGPTVASLNISIPSEPAPVPGWPSLQAHMGYIATASRYTVNPVAVNAVVGQAVRNVQVATISGPVTGDYSATVDWGNGETTAGTIVALGGDQFSVVASKPHPYTTVGSGTVRVSVTGPGTTPAPSVTDEVEVLAPPPSSQVAALPPYENKTSFTVSWSGSAGTSGSPIAFYDVYVSDNGGAYSLFQSKTTKTSATFKGVSGHTYSFYSIATDKAGTAQAPPASPQATTLIDTTAPTSSVAVLPLYETSTSFTVSWSGSDGASGSGIASYNVYVSDNGGSYKLFQANTTGTSATFTGVDGHSYRFYSQATDNAGNLQAKPSSAQATTRIDATAPTSSVAALPSFTNTATFTLKWSGADKNGSGLASYSVYVSDNGGAYQLLIGNTTATSKVFTGVDGHSYAFYSLATDKAGNIQSIPATPQTTTLVDLTSPTSSVAALPQFEKTTSFTVSWSGSDGANGSGIAKYIVYVSDNGSTYKQFVSTALTSAVFKGKTGHTYRFYSVAVDKAGNLQPKPAAAQAVTLVDSTPPTSKVAALPKTETSADFTVNWSGSDGSSGSGIASYNVFYSDNSGSFVLFQSNVLVTSAVFHGQAGHTYRFYCVATDEAGNVQPTPSSPQATTTVAI